MALLTQLVGNAHQFIPFGRITEQRYVHLLASGRGQLMFRTVTAEMRLHLNNNILAKYVCVGRRVCVHW